MHGLTLLLIFPLGPQQTRLWHPGVTGICTLVAAYPFAVVFGGLVARGMRFRASSIRQLALLGCVAALPAALSTGYDSLLVGRLVAGVAAGISFVGVHRLISGAAARHATRFSSRIVAFGMPLGIFAATWLDWRAGFALIGVGFLVVACMGGGDSATQTSKDAPEPAEPLPGALFVTGALALVSAAYLTVLSGFLVFNAGQTEYHISAVLLLGAFLGLAVPLLLQGLGARIAPVRVWGLSLGVSLLSITGLLALRGPLPTLPAIGLIAVFLATQSARHLALAGLVNAKLENASLPVHQTHTHLAHHLGSGLGAAVAGLVIHRNPQDGTLGGMPALWLVALIATAAAWLGGLALVQAKLRPAASADAANTFWRMTTSWVRSVRTSITRTPGSPT